MGMIPLIERPRAYARVCCIGLACAFSFLVFLLIGATAPEVLKAKEAGESNSIISDSTVNYAFSIETEKQNQAFWIEMRISTGNGDENEDKETIVDVELDMKLSVHPTSADSVILVDGEEFTKISRCDLSERWCEYFQLWSSDQIDYSGYAFNLVIQEPEEFADMELTDTSEPPFDISAKVIYVNPAFTRFALGWKYAFLILTYFVMFWPGAFCGLGGLCMGSQGFVINFLKTRHCTDDVNFNFHRRWTLALLVGLFFFDDPFVWGAVFDDNAAGFSGFFLFCSVLFMFLLLLYWLCLFSNLRFMEQQGTAVETNKKALSYWAPKLLLCFCIAVTALDSYFFYRFDDSTNFEYTGINDNKDHSHLTTALLGTFMSVYMIWIVYLLVRSRGLLKRMSVSYLLLYFSSLISCIVGVIGVFAAAFYPYSTSTSAFLALYGVINMYVWGLAGCFTSVDGVSNAPSVATGGGGGEAGLGGVGNGGVPRTGETEMAGVYPPTTGNADAVNFSNFEGDDVAMWTADVETVEVAQV